MSVSCGGDEGCGGGEPRRRTPAKGLASLITSLRIGVPISLLCMAIIFSALVFVTP